MPRSRSDLWGPIAGIVFVVLFVVGFSLNNLPDVDDSVSKITSYYNDGGNRAQIIIGSYLLVLGGVFFLWFLASLRSRLIAAEGEPARLTVISFASGIVFVAMLLVAACTFSTVAADIAFGGNDFAGAEGARYLPHLGYPILLIGGMFAAIAMIDATSILIVRTGMLPKWIGYYGFVAAVALLFTFAFFPILTFLLWVLFVSIAMLTSRRTAAIAPATPD